MPWPDIRECRHPDSTISLLERRGVIADTALRLSRYFGDDAQSWLNLQTAFDLRTAEMNPEL
jgi:addiction module HigA family antidote